MTKVRVSMKAIRVKEFGGPEVLRLEEVATPKAGAGEVVVRIKAAQRRDGKEERPSRGDRRPHVDECPFG